MNTAPADRTAAFIEACGKALERQAKAAKPAPTPQPARPLADAEPPEQKKTPEQILLESLRKQEQEREEAKRQHKGRGRSPMGYLLDAHFRKGNTPR